MYHDDYSKYPLKKEKRGNGAVTDSYDPNKSMVEDALQTIAAAKKAQANKALMIAVRKLAKEKLKAAEDAAKI